MPSLPPGIRAAFPLDASDEHRLEFSNNTHLQVLSRELDDFPADFLSIDICSIQVQYRQQGRVDDTLGLYVRIVNGSTILAAQNSSGGFRQVNITITNSTDVTSVFLNFPYVNTTADKAIWDGASVELQQHYNQNMGADGCRVEVNYVELSGAYTATGLLKIQNEVTQLIERVPLAASPAVLYQNPARVGPFVRASTGALYVALPDAINNNILGIWKRLEGEVFWSHVGTVANPITVNTSPVRHIAGIVDGDTLHLAWQNESSGGNAQRICYAALDLNTDSIGSAELAFSGTSGVVGNNGGMAVGFRADGTVLVFFRDYNGNALKLVRRTGVDTWASAQTVESTGTGSAIVGVMIGDDFHVFYNGFSSLAGAWHRVYRDDNTVSDRDQIVSTAATGGDLAGHAAIGDGRLFYGQSVGGTAPATFRAYSSSGQSEDETWSSETLSTDVDKVQFQGSSVGVVGAGNRVFAVWVDLSELQIHYSEWNSGTGTWGPPIDSNVDVADKSLIHFEAWVDTSGDVHIGGLWGASLSSTVNFFDINVGPAPTGAILKVQNESVSISESDFNNLITRIIKEVDETNQLSESNLHKIELAPTPTGHAGWGIPAGIR